MCFLLGTFYRDNFLVISWSEVFRSRDKEALGGGSQTGECRKIHLQSRQNTVASLGEKPLLIFLCRSCRAPALRRDPCLSSRRRHGRIRGTSSARLPPNPTIWGKQPTRWGNAPVWDTSGSPARLFAAASHFIHRRLGVFAGLQPAHTPRVHFLQEELFIGLTAHDQIRICFFISFLLCVVGEGSKKNSIWKLKHCLWFFWGKDEM